MNNSRKKFDTICVKDSSKFSKFAHTPPIFASSTFIYESPEKAIEVFKGNQESFIYGRWSHPNVELVEEKLELLEALNTPLELKGFLFSTGMAAISALFNSVLKPGDAIIAQGNIYGTTVELLNAVMAPRGIEIHYVDFDQLNQIEDVLAKHQNIKLVYAETPSNPTISCYNLKEITSLAHQYGAKMSVDNTFGTPYLQQPFLFGVDFVVHSTTKFLNGHGNALGGFLVGKDIDFMKNKVWKERKLHGAMMSPFDAWLLNNGLKTLSLRMDRHCANAMKVATYLEAHPLIIKTNYLGLKSSAYHELATSQMFDFGGVLSFELKNGLKASVHLMQVIKHCTLTASLGTADTLLQHPATMTHYNMPAKQREQYGITDGLIRLSVGIENVEDVIEDLDQAIT
jgi:methionine-gamma-lyase